MDVTIIKKSVKQLNNNDFQITVHVEVVDNSVIVFEADYSERYASNLAISTIKSKLQQQIANDFDKFKAEQALYNNTAFDGLAEELQTIANTYINQ